MTPPDMRLRLIDDRELAESVEHLRRTVANMRHLDTLSGRRVREHYQEALTAALAEVDRRARI